MSFLELAKNRYSSRNYLAKSVEREKIERCLEAGRLAPSATNAQPWHFIIVDEPELKQAVAKATLGPVGSINKFVVKAPVLIAVVAEKRRLLHRLHARIKKRPVHLIDIGICAEHICLQAVEEGLATCMLGWFKDEEVKRLLAIPEGGSVELIITLGYPADEVRKKKRKSLEEISSYNRYSKKGR